MERTVAQVTSPLVKFADDSFKFLNKCNKPDYFEFMKIAKATAMGFLIMGVVGFVVKLIFIPINNIILS